MTAIFRATCKIALVCVIVPAAALTACATQYHGNESGIDGVLWRQVASFKDPLSQDVFHPLATEPTAYLDTLAGARWDGATASAAHLRMEGGGAVLYGMSSTGTVAKFSVFISSGPRSDGPTDEGRDYNGPSAVFTCYGVTAHFDRGSTPRMDRTIFGECPAALVRTAPQDAAFASAEVFDG